MTEAEKFKRMALNAEKKAQAASASDAPWAMRNPRLYQNYASKWWGAHFAALREEESAP